MRDSAMTEVEAEAWWSPSLPDKRRVRHGCGAPLWVEVLAIVEEAVVVSFRSAVRGASPLPVYHCPGCGRVLKLWWTVEEWVGWRGGVCGVVGRAVVQRQRAAQPTRRPKGLPLTLIRVNHTS